MLFMEIIAVYSENLRNPQIQNATLMIVNAGGANSYHRVLKG
jgi:hypothetical protein